MITLHAPGQPSEFVDLADIVPGEPLPFHQGLPGYEVTPLWNVPLLADRLRVGRVLVKDESTRLGLPAFKMLGASWATARAIQREWYPQLADLTIDTIAVALAADPKTRRLAAATDGNHGRGVARMARMLGIHCSIFVPEGTAVARIEDIESEGASVTVVPGTYDDAIRRAAEEAGEATLVISDTSWEGYSQTPTDVIVGYSTMFREVDDALDGASLAQPDAVVLQAGVGSFAAAGLRHYRDPHRSSSLRTIIVEPSRANCLQQSASTGTLTEAPGPHPSTMAGLNCGLPSLLAWPVVLASTDVFAAIDDEHAHAAMAAYAEVGIVAGESGAASLGALLAASADPEQRQLLGLHAGSVMLLINTEGATDPINYRMQVGLVPDDVESTAAERRQSTGTTAIGLGR